MSHSFLKKNLPHLGEHLKNMAPNSDLQLIKQLQNSKGCKVPDCCHIGASLADILRY